MTVLIGTSFAAGIMILVNAVVARRHRVIQQIGNYSGVTSAKSKGLVEYIFEATQTLFTKERFSPWGTNEQIQVTLIHSGSTESVNAFRRQQFLWCVGSEIGFILWLLLKYSGREYPSPLLIVFCILGCWLSSGWVSLEFLRAKAKQRSRTVDLELPTVLDLIAFSAAAGEPIILAMNRVAATCSGELPDLIRTANQNLTAGSTLAQVFRELRTATSSTGLFRSVHAIELAIEHGTPLAEVLRAQAHESRLTYRQNLMKLAGQKETLMMVPVIFLILPMIVFVALFPGLQALHFN